MTNGVSFSQQGIDLKDAQDSQKSLDSRWRYYDLILEKRITFKDLGSFTGLDYLVYEHKLNFLPAYTLYHIATDTYIGGQAFSGAASIKEQTSINGLVSDDTKIYFTGFYDGTAYSGTDVILRIYNVPITEEYRAPTSVASAKSTSMPSTKGVKFLNENNASNISDGELARFSLNTASKSLAIHKTGIAPAETSTNFRATITHNLGAPPNFLVAYTNFKKDLVTPVTYDIIYILAEANAATIVFRGAQSALIANIAYVVFKEFADTAV